MEKKEITEKKIKTRIGEIQEENEKIKKDKDKKYFEEQKDIEKKTKEVRRKKIKDEEEKLQLDFSNKVGTDIVRSKKLIGFIKRYVLIGIVTGVPGIAITYLWDKWQENKMVKELYQKNIEAVVNPSNRELAREYELLRKKFYKAYDIDKIEKLLMTSNELEKLKDDNKSIQKLTEEIRKAREIYTKNLDNYIEDQIIAEQKEVIEKTEEEIEIGQEKIFMK